MAEQREVEIGRLQSELQREVDTFYSDIFAGGDSPEIFMRIIDKVLEMEGINPATVDNFQDPDWMRKFQEQTGLAPTRDLVDYNVEVDQQNDTVRVWIKIRDKKTDGSAAEPKEIRMQIPATSSVVQSLKQKRARESEEYEREQQEHRRKAEEFRVRLLPFAQEHQGQSLSAEDWKKQNMGEMLGYNDLPTGVDVWTIESVEGAVRIVLWKKDKATGIKTIFDIHEFGG